MVKGKVMAKDTHMCVSSWTAGY